MRLGIFPKLRGFWILCVEKAPVVLKRFIQIGCYQDLETLVGLNRDQDEEKGVLFRCTFAFCLYHGWDLSENASHDRGKK